VFLEDERRGKTMKTMISFCVALAFSAGVALAEDLKSGLQPGAPIGAFDVLKCAGAVDDGVKVGTQLCYRCKYGARPMVMIFSRGGSAPVAALAKQLDKAVAENSDKKLAAFVNLLGEDREKLEADAKQLGAKSQLANVPVVVPVEFENGPDNYGINPKADVTVILAQGGKVKATHAFAKGEFGTKGAEAVVADLPKILGQ
jgi:hypothetical protein